MIVKSIRVLCIVVIIVIIITVWIKGWIWIWRSNVAINNMSVYIIVVSLVTEICNNNP